MALFSVENREVGNWSSEEDERRDAQLGELSGGVELHEGLFIGVERWWREGGKRWLVGRRACSSPSMAWGRVWSSWSGAERRHERRGGTR